MWSGGTSPASADEGCDEVRRLCLRSIFWRSFKGIFKNEVMARC